MKKSILYLVLISLFINKINAQYSIGHTTINFIDSSRNNRVIQTEVYYPALTNGEDIPCANDSFPSVVFGHGFVMAWRAYQNIWEEIVPRGYIMLFPRTEGNLISTNHQQFGWDLQFLVKAIHKENLNSQSIFYNHVKDATALMGHSMGGGASFLAADSLCSSNNKYLKTLIGLAPAESTTNGVSSISSATRVNIPSVIFSGSQDGVTPPQDHHIPMYDSLNSNCKTFINIIGGAHCYFANPNFNCDFGESTSSSGISITRAQQHAVLFDFVNPWLDYTLKEDCSKFDVFNDSLNSSLRVTYMQECYSHQIPQIMNQNGVLYTNTPGSSFQWFVNGNIIPNATDSSLIPTTGGIFQVEVFFEDSCSKLSSGYNYVVTSSKVNQVYKNSSIYILNNPVSNYLNINSKNPLSSIKIYSITGQLIEEHNSLNAKNIELNVSSFRMGLYIIIINNQNSLKFIKVK